MGEAKRRGTREQRIAQAVERKKREDAEAHQRYLADEAERREREARRRTAHEVREAMFTRERPVVVGGGNSLHARLMLASLAGLLAAPARNVPLLIADPQDDEERASTGQKGAKHGG